jgi:hypothetical protein
MKNSKRTFGIFNAKYSETKQKSNFMLHQPTPAKTSKAQHSTGSAVQRY